MRRGNLPFSLFLIIIVLGAFGYGFVYPQLNLDDKDKNKAVETVVGSQAYISSLFANGNENGAPVRDMVTLQEEIANMNSGSRAATVPVWTQLGPDNFGGRTRAVIFDNRDETGKTVYAAAVAGGVFKSMNSGITWYKINQATYNLNASCMTQAANGDIYIGTGEGFLYANGVPGRGVFKSTDGESFALLESTTPDFSGDTEDWRYVFELAIDESNNRIYASTNAGLKYSDDGGMSWGMAKDTAGNELALQSMDVKVSSGFAIATVDNLCYVSSSGAPDAFVLKSLGDSISLPNEDVSRIEFAIAPSDANIIYASIVNSSGTLKGVYRSETKGEQWRVVMPGSPNVDIFQGIGEYANTMVVFPNDPGHVILSALNMWEGKMIQEEGFFAWEEVSQGIFHPLQSEDYGYSYVHFFQHAIAFHPQNQNLFLIGSDGGMFKGELAGNIYTYESMNRNYYSTLGLSVAPSGQENYVVGGTSANGLLFITGEGNTPKAADQLGAYMGSGYTSAISLLDNEVMVLSFGGDNLFRTENAGFTFSAQFLPGGFAALGTVDVPIALWENFDNVNSRDSLWYHAKDDLTAGSDVFVMSRNASYPFIHTLDNNLAKGDSIQLRDPISSYLFIATPSNLYLTHELHRFDKQPEWWVIADESVGYALTGGDIPTAIAYSSDANHVYVGTAQGKLFRISNLAFAYNYERADVNSPSCVVSTTEITLSSTEPIRSISIDQQNAANVMITQGNLGQDDYIFLTENGLDQHPEFVSKQGNLPSMLVFSSVMEMTDPNMAIVGTEYGIFITDDIHAANPVWTQDEDKMGSVPVLQLKQQTVKQEDLVVELVNGNEVEVLTFLGTNNYGVLYASTFGRSMFKSKTFQKPVGLPEVFDGGKKLQSLKMYPNPVENQAVVEFTLAKKADVHIQTMDINGRLVNTQRVEASEGVNKVQLEVSGLATGTYIIKVSADQQVLVHKFIKN